MKKIEKISSFLRANKGWLGQVDSNQEILVRANNILAGKVNELIDEINQIKEDSAQGFSTDAYIVKTTDSEDASALFKYRQMRNALFEIKANMWRTWKHDEESLTLDSLREKVSDIFEDNGIHDSDLGL